MNRELANALFPYFESVYSLNKNLITLCGVNIIDNRGQYEANLCDLVQIIPRLIPYSSSKGQSYSIDKRDGLLDFSSELPWLKDRFDNLLEKHRKCLESIKAIRNKLEHKMHSVKLNEAMSDSSIFFSVNYTVDGEEKTLASIDLISLVKDLNSIYVDLQKELDRFVFVENESGHPYYRRLLRYNFTSFNILLSSELLPLIGGMQYQY